MATALAQNRLGFQAESSTWRNAYLLGARELREGVRRMFTGGAGSLNANVVSVLPMEMYFDFLAIRVDGIKAQDLVGLFDWVLPDVGESWKLTLVNGALSHARGSHGGRADATVRLDRAGLTRLLGSGASLQSAVADGAVHVDGNRALFERFLSTLEEFDPNFNILEP